MAVFESGKSVFLLFVCAGLASCVIITFLNWEAQRRFGDDSKGRGDTNVFIIDEHKESTSSEKSAVSSRFISGLLKIKRALKEKLRRLLLDDEETEIPSTINEDRGYVGRKLQGLPDSTNKDALISLEKQLLKHEGRKTIRHLKAKIRRLSPDSELVKGILKHFCTKCSKHSRRTETADENDLHVSTYMRARPKGASLPIYEIIPQASQVDVTHDDKSGRSKEKEQSLLCGSFGDVILIVIVTTLINWTILIIAMILRAIFKQRHLLYEDEEEDEISITTVEQRYTPLHNNYDKEYPVFS